MASYMKKLSRHRPLRIVAALVIVFSLTGRALGDDPGPWPARDWNAANLARIKAPPTGVLTFAVFGDNRNGDEVFIRLLRQMGRDPDLAFAVALGDMVPDGKLEQYHDFFQIIRGHLRLPLLTLVGNHELPHDKMRRLYQVIFGPCYYSFQIDDHYFIMVDGADKNGPDEEQYCWLEEELHKAQTAKTRLVFLHIPLFDPRGGDNHHCLPEASGRRLAALFKQYRVTHIFAAHIHSYFTGPWEGVPYTITGGAGAKLYGTDPEHFFFHYLKVAISGNRVEIQVRRLDEEGGQ